MAKKRRKKIEPRTVAVIDIGSSAIRMIIAEIRGPGKWQILEVAEQRLGRCQLGKHLVDGAIEQFALFRQQQPPRVPMKQGRRDRLFQHADLAANRGLAQMQLLAGMGKAASLSHGVKDTQFIPVHRHDCLSAG